MAELAEFSLWTEQFDSMMRFMINQDDYETSEDRLTAFDFKMEWLGEWIIETCVDKDDFWKQLDKIKANRGTKTQSIADMFGDCLEEFVFIFNDKTVFKVCDINEAAKNAIRGYTNNLNKYMAGIEFAKHLNIQNVGIEHKIKEYIKPFLTTDFSKFSTSTFIKKLREWVKQVTEKK
jgi:hypothetical protein